MADDVIVELVRAAVDTELDLLILTLYCHPSNLLTGMLHNA